MRKVSVFIHIEALIEKMAERIGQSTPELELLNQNLGHFKGELSPARVATLFTGLLLASGISVETVPEVHRHVVTEDGLIDAIVWVAGQVYTGSDPALRELSLSFPLNALAEGVALETARTTDFLTYRLTRMARRLYNASMLSPTPTLLRRLVEQARALNQESMQTRGFAVLASFPSTVYQASVHREMDLATYGGGSSRFSREQAERFFRIVERRARTDVSCFMTDQELMRLVEESRW